MSDPGNQFLTQQATDDAIMLLTTAWEAFDTGEQNGADPVMSTRLVRSLTEIAMDQDRMIAATANLVALSMSLLEIARDAGYDPHRLLQIFALAGQR